jgi:hypothetical protein
MLVCDNIPDSSAGVQSECSLQNNQQKNKQPKQNKLRKRECAMARTGLNYLPRQNPCAQCGKPIAMPEWIESSGGRACYLWHCWACDYRFEAIAFFDEAEQQPIAA